MLTAGAGPAARPSVFIVDDHPLFRLALRQILHEADTVEFDSFDALRRRLETGARADLVLLDLLMPDVEGFSSLLYLRSCHPAMRVAIVSGHDEAADIRRALDFGACGYVPKTLPPTQLAEALRTLIAGASWAPPTPPGGDSADREMATRLTRLSPQQLRVLLALGRGQLNKQIGHELGVTEATVKFHVSGILRQLGLQRRTQAAVLAQRLAEVRARTPTPPPAR